MNSATTMDIQMPSMSQMVGKSSTAATWNTSVRKNEMAAEVSVEDEVYPLADDETQSMYAYDLYYGPLELLDYAFGAWTPEMAAHEMEENA